MNKTAPFSVSISRDR